MYYDYTVKMTRILNRIEEWFTSKEQQTIQEFIQLRLIGRLVDMYPGNTAKLVNL